MLYSKTEIKLGYNRDAWIPENKLLLICESKLNKQRTRGCFEGPIPCHNPAPPLLPFYPMLLLTLPVLIDHLEYSWLGWVHFSIECNKGVLRSVWNWNLWMTPSAPTALTVILHAMGYLTYTVTAIWVLSNHSSEQRGFLGIICSVKQDDPQLFNNSDSPKIIGPLNGNSMLNAQTPFIQWHTCIILSVKATAWINKTTISVALTCLIFKWGHVRLLWK